MGISIKKLLQLILNLQDKVILIIAPHPDDEAISSGGFLIKAKEEGSKVFAKFFCIGTEVQYGTNSVITKREIELQNAMRYLDIDGYELVYKEKNHLFLDTVPQKELSDEVEKKGNVCLKNQKPDILIFPGKSYSQDHNSVNSACITATRPYPNALKHTPNIILTYQHFDETVWSESNSHRKTNFFVDISNQLEAKEELLNCYTSQMKPHSNHYRNIKNILKLNSISGLKIGKNAAEEFLCLKYQI